MGRDNGQPVEPATPATDFVVIDRTALNQLLDAVANVLAATRGVEQLDAAGEIEPELREQATQEIGQARDALIDGIVRMKESVSQLPSVKLSESE